MVSIRPARPAECETVADLHERSIRALGPAAYDAEQVDAWAANKDPDRYAIEEPGSHFVVAVEGESILGFGELVPDEREVRAVYVDPERAGEGVGRRLLAHLEATARERGLERLHLRSSKNAAGFYERCGWRAGETVVHETTGGVELGCVRMTKRLDGG